MSKKIVAVDPGVAGQIVFRTSNTIYLRDIPETPQELSHIFSEIVHPEEWVCYLELVRCSPIQGVKSSFTFGKGYGMLLQVLADYKIKTELVTPSTWQRYMGCMSKGNKHITKAAASRLFPSIKCTHKNSDALLISEYGMRVEKS